MNIINTIAAQGENFEKCQWQNTVALHADQYSVVHETQTEHKKTLRCGLHFPQCQLHSCNARSPCSHVRSSRSVTVSLHRKIKPIAKKPAQAKVQR